MNLKKWLIGIDIGGTTVKIGQFSLEGKLIDKWEIHTNKEAYGSHIINDIAASIDSRLDLDDVLGYGFGVPGPVQEDVVEICVNLGWKDYHLKDAFSKLVNNDNIRVNNDANVATLGESYFGAGVGKDNIAMITLGTGVGGGLVLYNRVYSGYNGNAGEIGHLTIPSKHTFHCNCGRDNCLETHASATGVKNIYNELKKEYETSSLFIFEAPSAKKIFDHAKSGDPLAVQVVDEVTSAIAYACQVVASITNPGMVLIGGGLAKAGDFLLKPIQEKFCASAFGPTKGMQIKLATLGNDAGIYGAARMVMNRD